MANSDDRYEMLRDRELSKLSWVVKSAEKIYSVRWLRPIASTVNQRVDRGLNHQPSG